MTFLLNCAVQVLVILTIALLTLPFLRRESAALRHCVLSVAVVFSLLTPAFNLVMPVFEWSALVSQHPSIVPIREQISEFTSSAPPAARSQDANSRNAAPAASTEASNAAGAFARLSLMVWVSGVVVGLIVLLTGLVRLAVVVSASTPMRSERWIRLTALISSEYGLNRGLPLVQDRKSAVLVHFCAVF